MIKKLLTLAITVFAIPAYALDLDTIGNVYDIKEQDVIEAIKERASKHDWEKFYDDAKKQILADIGKGTEVLPKAQKDNTFYVDITTTVNDSIYTRDEKGKPKMLYPSGYKFNALDYTTLHQSYVIFDATRPEELNWYKENYAKDLSVMPIITQGNVIDLSGQIKREVYLLDDEVRKALKVKATPTHVYQEKNKLRADEFYLEVETVSTIDKTAEVVANALIGIMDTFAADAHAASCSGSFLNPITDVRWSCMLPITLAGVSFSDLGMPEAASAVLADKMVGPISPVCFCVDPIPRAGLTFAMNNVFRIGESVKDAGCMPSLGFGIPLGSYFGQGGQDTGAGRQLSQTTFTYTHMLEFIPTAMLGVMIDVLCLQSSDSKSPLTMMYFSEFMPQAKSSELALILAPESLLFANPIAQAYCMVDAALTIVELTDPIGYWCVGGHSIFPLSNHAVETEYVDAASINVAKMLFTSARTGQLLTCLNASSGVCSCLPSPIWNKIEYRFQIAKPIPDTFCRRMGKPSLIWNIPNKNPALTKNVDNLAFLIWRRRNCCIL